ncbi:hypothetical protein [Thalassobacillus sp. C254]|uniref:hypothetical protein n=1 Tax=Thalassobacillus sp. C254 TaxID=1225341 RepID=UPI0006D18DA5|nr:hypothetical protein [Thalassobacillus sp. C254]
MGFLSLAPGYIAVYHNGSSTGSRIFYMGFWGKSTFTIGTGKKLFNIGPMEFRRIYFWHSFCQIEKLKWDTKTAHVLILLGGTIFNILSVFVVNSMIVAGILPEHIIFYNFVYFTIYFVFFSLFPARFSEDHPSDLMAIYDLFKYGKGKDPID